MVDTSAGRPPLASYPSTPPDSPPRHTPHFRRRSRWLRPLIILAIPPLLLFLYTLAYPLIPSLPAPPRIRIETGDPINASSALPDPQPSAPVISSPDACVCGVTDRGKALCNVYQPTGLRASRIAHSTGARLRRVLGKARDGNVIKVGVLGGSGELGSSLEALGLNTPSLNTHPTPTRVPR